MKELYFLAFKRVATIIQETGDEVEVKQILKAILPGIYEDGYLQAIYTISRNEFKQTLNHTLEKYRARQH